MSDHPRFEEFKRRALRNPEVRRAYVEAKIRRGREDAQSDEPRDNPRPRVHDRHQPTQHERSPAMTKPSNYPPGVSGNEPEIAGDPEEDRHPVPRIEYVETPHRDTEPYDSMVTPVREANQQPWHVRYVGGNGETLATSEQLTSRDACATNALALAHLFGVHDPTIETGPYWSSLTGYVGETVAVVPVVEVRS